MINESDLIMWTPGMTLAHIERQVILKAFRHYRGNKAATSSALGISVRTLDARLAEYQAQKQKDQEVVDEYRRKQTELLDRQRNGTRAKENTEQGPDAGHERSPQSLAEISQKLKMSVPERKEVQEMLPSEAQPARVSQGGGRLPKHSQKAGGKGTSSTGGEG